MCPMRRRNVLAGEQSLMQCLRGRLSPERGADRMRSVRGGEFCNVRKRGMPAVLGRALELRWLKRLHALRSGTPWHLGGCKIVLIALYRLRRWKALLRRWGQ